MTDYSKYKGLFQSVKLTEAERKEKYPDCKYDTVQFGGDFLYILEAETGPIKIGMSKSPLARFQMLSLSTYMDLNLRIVSRTPGGITRILEQKAHVMRQDSRIRGEWYSCSYEDAKQAIFEVNPLGPCIEFKLGLTHSKLLRLPDKMWEREQIPPLERSRPRRYSFMELDK